jgi:hypothetical protein
MARISDCMRAIREIRAIRGLSIDPWQSVRNPDKLCLNVLDSFRSRS